MLCLEPTDGWRKLEVIDPPTPSFSGWFGKDVALKSNLLAVVEAGRDITGTNRSGSALVHVYERVGENWLPRTNISLPFAQCVALDGNWVALAAGAPTRVPGNHLHLYRVHRGPTGIELRLHTNFLAEARGNFWKPTARVALEADLCILSSTGDVSFDGAPGEVKVYQRDAADVWHLRQVLHSPTQPTSGIRFTNDWRYNSAGGTWRIDGTQQEIGIPMTSRLTSRSAVVESYFSPVGGMTGGVILSFRHRWSFEQNAGGRWDGGQVRVSVNGGPFTAVPHSAFTQNGYNGTVSAISASELRGQAAFTGQSTGFVARTLVTSTCNLGRFDPQTTLAIQFRYGGDLNERASVPNWEIDSVDLGVEFFHNTGASNRITLLSENFDAGNGGFAVHTEEPLAPDRYGFSLALRDGWLAIGAPRDDQAAQQAGAAHLY